MQCLACSSDQMVAVVTLVKYVPMADRNGTLKVGGLKLGQIDAKEAWDNDETPGGLVAKRIRGPILCLDCQSEHHWVVAERKLHLGKSG